MENKPEKADDSDPKSGVDASKVGHTEHGIPKNPTDEEPTGYPTSDRHHSEIAPSKT